MLVPLPHGGETISLSNHRLIAPDPPVRLEHAAQRHAAEQDEQLELGREVTIDWGHAVPHEAKGDEGDAILHAGASASRLT